MWMRRENEKQNLLAVYVGGNALHQNVMGKCTSPTDEYSDPNTNKIK